RGELGHCEMMRVSCHTFVWPLIGNALLNFRERQRAILLGNHVGAPSHAPVAFCFGENGKFGAGQVMKHRLIRALLLGVSAAATFSMGVSIVQAAEECRLKPDSTAQMG